MIFNLLSERSLVHIDKPISELTTKWRPFGWDSKVEIEGNVVDIRDLFFKHRFITKIQKSTSWYSPYVWKEFNTLENLSYEIYNHTGYWWTIPLVNNITNPIFEFPLNNQEIDDMVDLLLTENSNGILIWKNYINSVVGLRLRNDIKEQYNIYSNDIVFTKNEWNYLKTNNPSISLLLESMVSSKTIETISIEYSIFQNNYNDLPTNFQEEFILRSEHNTNIVTKKEFLDNFETYVNDYYELFFGVLRHYEIEANEDKKQIILIKPNYLGEFIYNLKLEISQSKSTDGFFHYKKNE